MTVFLCSIALAASPDWPTLTVEEQGVYDAGALVLRADSRTSLTDSTGIVRVAAPAALLWQEALDFRAKLPENPTLRTLDEYARNSPNDWFVRFELSVFGIHVVIHDHWTCFPAELYCTWVQDETRESDVSREKGFLIVRSEGSGSAIVFHSEFVSDVWSPGWLRRWLANDSMVNIVEKLKARTERKATGSKTGD